MRQRLKTTSCQEMTSIECDVNISVKLQLTSTCPSNGVTRDLNCQNENEVATFSKSMVNG